MRYELTGAVPSSGVISRANSGGGQIKRKGNNGGRVWSCVRGAGANDVHTTTAGGQVILLTRC